MMHVVHVSLVRPAREIEPEALPECWPTLHEVARAARRAGARVTVVQSCSRTAEFERDDVRYRFVHEPALPGRPTGCTPSAIAGAVERLAPDAIHLNGLDFGWHTRALTRVGRPVLVQDHASRPGSQRRRWGLRDIAGVAFTARDQVGPFHAAGDLRREIPVYEVPESSTRFQPGSQEAARGATGLHGNPAVLWVGRLNANKNPLGVLEAIELAAAALPEVRLWCCFHESPMLQQVRARIARSPVLRERVVLLGAKPRETIETLMRAADFFMLGSRFEGSGYALIEAIACGATPIASDIAPFRALTGNGRIGRLAPWGDAHAFAEALIALAREDRGGQRLRARAWFDEALSFERIGERLVAIYRDLTGQPR
jgi:glycosyltransferase involved in cell wall biosynthesis